MRILSRAKRDQEALALYEDAPKILRDRPSLIRRAATAAENQGDSVTANIYLTRAALRDGLFEQALRQVKVAEKAAGSSDPQLLLEIGQLRKTARRELGALPKDK